MCRITQSKIMETLTRPTEEELAIGALYEVIDPGLYVNVMDRGLIFELAIPDAHHIDVLVTLSTPQCAMGNAITDGFNIALEAVFPEREIHVQLTFDPPWSFERLTEEGRNQLGF